MSSSVLDPQASCEKLNSFVKRYVDLYKLKLEQASRFRSRGEIALSDMYERDAYFTLGFALHPVMDSTSPSHREFQNWRNRDFHKHGNFWNSQEDLNYLLNNPTVERNTIDLMLRAVQTGKGLDCSCGR